MGPVGLGSLDKRRFGNTWGFLASHRNTNPTSVFVEVVVLGNELLIPLQHQGTKKHQVIEG